MTSLPNITVGGVEYVYGKSSGRWWPENAQAPIDGGDYGVTGADLTAAMFAEMLKSPSKPGGIVPPAVAGNTKRKFHATRALALRAEAYKIFAHLLEYENERSAFLDDSPSLNKALNATRRALA